MSIQKQARLLLIRQRTRQANRQLSLLNRVAAEVKSPQLGINSDTVTTSEPNFET